MSNSNAAPKRTGKARSQQRQVSRRRWKINPLDALIALALISSPPTDQEIHYFMEECRTGKHKLNAKDIAALKKAKPELRRKLQAIFRRKPANNALSQSHEIQPQKKS